MAQRTITSADSIYLLTIPDIFPVPVQLQGFAADAAFAFDAIDPAETVIGVDGIMSAGYTPYLTQQTISIMPDSPSLAIFETWLNLSNVNRTAYFANAVITLPAIGRIYNLTRGVLTGAKNAPDAKKVLQAVEYKITWNRVEPAFA